jgi:hypothetical protein
MDSNTAHLLLGALLAIVGGMIGELWREGRANRAEVRVLRGEIEGLLAICEQMLAAPRDLSLMHWLPQLSSFAREGYASSRSWLRAVPNQTDRAKVLQIFAMASSLVGTIEQFVSIEKDAMHHPDHARYGSLITSHRDIEQPGLLILQHQAREAYALLEGLAERPILL